MFSWFGSRKESKTGKVLLTGSSSAKWSLGAGSDRNRAADFAKEAYQLNVVAFQAINKTADAVAAIPFYVVNQRGEEVKNSPLFELLRKPNPVQSGSEFMRALVGFYRIAGNAYIERVKVGRQVRELYALRPDRMRVKTSTTGLPAGYIYTVNNDHVVWHADEINGESDIRQLKSFNPLSDWYGMSPVMAGAFSVDQHNEAMKHIQALLQNGAAPSGAMEVDGELSDEQFNRLKAEISEKYTGSGNAGRPMLLEGGMKWQQMGLSPVDMSIIETKYSAARDISLALGVPPLLLNIPGDSTYTNYREARLAFYEETIIPLAELIKESLNSWLSSYFGGQMLELDYDKIPAIAEKRRELWTMADQSTDLTINERRAIKGYEKIEGGDQVLVQSSMIPLDFATAPIDLGAPSSVDAKTLNKMAYGATN